MQIGQIKIQAIEDLQLASDDQKKKKSFLSNPDCPLPFAFLLELFFQLGDVRTCVF